MDKGRNLDLALIVARRELVGLSRATTPESVDAIVVKVLSTYGLEIGDASCADLAHEIVAFVDAATPCSGILSPNYARPSTSTLSRFLQAASVRRAELAAGQVRRDELRSFVTGLLADLRAEDPAADECVWPRVRSTDPRGAAVASHWEKYAARIGNLREVWPEACNDDTLCSLHESVIAALFESSLPVETSASLIQVFWETALSSCDLIPQSTGDPAVLEAVRRVRSSILCLDRAYIRLEQELRSDCLVDRFDWM